MQYPQPNAVRRSLVPLLALTLPLSLASAQKSTVTFAFWGGETELKLTQGLEKQFESQNPDIDVKLQQIANDDYEQKILVQYAGGRAPDVMVIRDTSSSYLARRGLFTDLGPYIKKTKFDVRGLDAATTRSYSLGNVQYGLPRAVTPVVTYYNKAMFDAAGVPYPTANWTWNDFLTAARKLTRDTNRDGKIDQWGTFMTPWDALFLPIVYTYGGNILSADGTRSTLLQPETVAAFTYANDLINRYKVAPPLTQAESMGWIEGFSGQKYAMIFQGRWATPIFLDAMTKAKANFQFDVAPVPKGKLRKTVQYSDALGILRTSRNKDAAFRWVAFLTSEKGQAGYGGVKSLTVPANLKVAQTLVAPGAQPAKSSLFLSEAKYGSPPPQSPSFAALYEIVNRNLREVFLGLKTVNAGLTKADGEVNTMLKKSYDSLR